MYFTQVVCEGNMEGPPDPRAFRKQETPILACFSGKDRFKVNFVSSVEDVDIEVFLPQPLPWHHYLHCSWGKGGIFKLSWKTCFYFVKVERMDLVIK